ncbi:MAG: hypothetical protein LBR36_06365 [Bacteroidales bacterium]|jgi:hypothetical protein|nr:hypothetical protein [Bacteroidales bacterium]
MKRLIYSVLAVATMAAFSFNAVAQKVKFAGTITYSVSFSGKTDPAKHVPHTYSEDVWGNMTKRTQNNGGIGICTITDGDSAKVTQLFDTPFGKVGISNKMDFTESEQKIKKEVTPQPDKDKTICGYACKCYQITITDLEDDDTQDILLWTTTEIGENENVNSLSLLTKGLSGYVLSMVIESPEDEITQTVEATQIKKTKIKSVDFVVPDSYKMMSEDEFKEFVQTNFGGSGEEE